MALSRFIARLRAQQSSCLDWLCGGRSPHPGSATTSPRRSRTLLLLMIMGATALYLYLYHEALLQSTSVNSLPRLTRPLQRFGRKELALTPSQVFKLFTGLNSSSAIHHTAAAASLQHLEITLENLKTATWNWSALPEERKRPALSSQDLKAASKNPKTARLNGSALLQERNHTGLSSQDLKAASEILKAGILEGSSLPLLTLFSTWTDREDIETVRNLTLRNWSQLRPFIQPLLFTNSSRLAARARSYGWEALPVSRAAVGVPVLKCMYIDAMKRFNSSLYSFANGDILFTSSLVDSLLAILSDRLLPLDKHPLLAIGQRTNVAKVTDAEALTFSNISKVAKARGKLFMVLAEDYFITDRRFGWERVPDLVIGRTAYDNWLVWHALRQRHVVVDITQTSVAVHQTTRFGNFEGRQHANASYNSKLLGRLYKRSFYGTGRTSCAPWKTLRTKEGDLKVEKRKKHC